jgi:hypothetical protein
MTPCLWRNRHHQNRCLAPLFFYTLFETAKLSQIDPRAYVTRAATRAIQDPGAVTLPSDLT